MFRLVAVQENVRIKPADLGRPLVEAVLAELDESYLDKVIANVGLVVATYDVQVCAIRYHLDLRAAASVLPILHSLHMAWLLFDMCFLRIVGCPSTTH